MTFEDPDGRPVLPPEVRGFIDPDDPDLELVVDAIEAMTLVGFEVSDPETLRLALVSDPETLRLALVAAHNRGDKIREAGSLDSPFRLASRHRRAELAVEARQRLAELDQRAVVYYMRLGNRVKIGYTLNLRARVGMIQPEEVLATETGGPTLEAQRHRQFHALRVSGEWFKYEGLLVRHVAELRRQTA